MQLIVNTNLLREIDERKLINAYARFVCNSDEDLTDDLKIKENLKQLLDWDINGDNGLGIYCSKFESLKKNDWERLINFIKEYSPEIKILAYAPRKQKRLNSIKEVNSMLEAREAKNIERFTDKNYTVSGRGSKAKPCIYEGKEYKSRQECIYKEGITKAILYKYLKKTNQL